MSASLAFRLMARSYVYFAFRTSSWSQSNPTSFQRSPSKPILSSLTFFVKLEYELKLFLFGTLRCDHSHLMNARFGKLCVLFFFSSKSVFSFSVVSACTLFHENIAHPSVLKVLSCAQINCCSDYFTTLRDADRCSRWLVLHTRLRIVRLTTCFEGAGTLQRDPLCDSPHSD